MKIVMPQPAYEMLVAYAKAQAPVEACGLLGGTIAGQCKMVKKIYYLANADNSPEHFALDPREQFAAIKEMREQGWSLLGNWHSHPATPSRPSEEDKRLAFDPALSYLILSLAAKPVLHSFQVAADKTVTQEAVQLMDQEAMMADYKELKKGGFMRQKQKDNFSMRLKSVGGHFTAAQLAAVQQVAEKFGKGYVHLTSRQGIEVPFIQFKDIEAAKHELQAGGVQVGVCGPRVRTITACQGQAVCPSGLIDTVKIAAGFDKRYGGRELPHKFKFGITGCHNNCLKTEENDLGVKGGILPQWHQAACTYCGVCQAVCPEQAILVDQEAKTVQLTAEHCAYCGKCIKSCPTDAWAGKKGFVLSFGGLYGNRIAIGRHFLPIIFDEAKVYGIVDAALAFFEKQARPGERFCNCLDRVGWDSLQRELEALL